MRCRMWSFEELRCGSSTDVQQFMCRMMSYWVVVLGQACSFEVRHPTGQLDASTIGTSHVMCLRQPAHCSSHKASPVTSQGQQSWQRTDHWPYRSLWLDAGVTALGYHGIHSLIRSWTNPKLTIVNVTSYDPCVHLQVRHPPTSSGPEALDVEQKALPRRAAISRCHLRSGECTAKGLTMTMMIINSILNSNVYSKIDHQNWITVLAIHSNQLYSKLYYNC